MTFSVALALLLGLSGTPARAADEKPRLKGLGGFSTEKQRQRTTEDEPQVVDQTMRSLFQNAQDNPYLTPQMKQQVEGMIQQTEQMQATAAGVEYSRPAGMGFTGQNPRGARTNPRKAAPAPDLRAVAPQRTAADATPPVEPSVPAAYAAAGPAAPPGAGPYVSLRETPAKRVAVPDSRRAAWPGNAEAAKQAVERDPNDGGALENLAREEFAQGRYAEAADAAGKAVAVQPKNATVHMLRAMAREQLGDRSGALHDAHNAARLAPDLYAARVAAAAAGAALFDPSSAESWGLLRQMSPPPPPDRDGLWTALLVLLSLGAAGAAGHAAWTLWKDMPPEQQRRLLGVWHKAVTGQSLPTLRPAASAPTATPPPRREVSLKAGRRIGEKFDLVRPIGRDGTVEIWKARDATLDRDVLLKRLYSGPSSAELDLRRADALQAAGLHHPNIVELYEIVELPEGLFVVYEYASGKSLRQVLAEKTTLSLRAARDVMVPVCRALEHAHRRGLAHGGLAPERIVLTRQGYVKVMDFVLARTMGAGAQDYAAPEAKRGAPTPASDVYSLGICLHEILSGGLPGNIDWTPPPGFDELLERSLDLDARTRLASARAFLDALKAVPADTRPPRQLEAPLTMEPDEETTDSVAGVVGEAGGDPLINPGPPTSPDHPPV
ncbi:MAG: protein kinase [Elusimicrobia bacterium]|nr:protein kinase [Elusimicrobiota bacterium]